MRKILALFGVFLLAAVAPKLTAKERRGADVVAVTKNAQVVRGELIAVKGQAILVVDSATGGDHAIDISDLNSLSVVIAKKSNPWAAAAVGCLIGGGIGALVGHEIGKPDGGLDFSTPFTVGGAALGAITGGGSGYLIAAHKKKKDLYTFEGKSPAEIDQFLASLRLNARVPDFR